MALRALSSRSPAAYHYYYHSSITLTKAHYLHGRSKLSIRGTRRFFSEEAISRPSNLVQLYTSRSTNPYVNLSIEHFLLQKSHPDSVVLLLYTNRPCVVIGRNQNPWVEVNLGLVNQPGILSKLRAESDSKAAERKNHHEGGKASPTAQDANANADADDDVLLVRRRSGGGTVFHDEGNVNYSVICPPASFHRDKHAEMVVRALRAIGRDQETPLSVRVNERHDIVLDTHQAPLAEEESRNATATFKISGSAYKITRTRALHHGTCLLSSPNLPLMSRLLHSPAEPYIKARGVESVRSPVRNVGFPNALFEDAVVAEFLAMYSGSDGDGDDGVNPQPLAAEIIDPASINSIPEIQSGVTELRSRDWIYGQTPQFTFSSHPTPSDPRPRPPIPADLPSIFFPPTQQPNSSSSDSSQPLPAALRIDVRQGRITEAAITPNTKDLGDPESSAMVEIGLTGLHVYRVDDWREHLSKENAGIGRWLNELFGVSKG